MRRSITKMYDVYEYSKNTWIVRGRRRLGDGEAIYVVEFDEERGSFKCTCHQPYKPYAKSRRRACSHVGACLFHHLFSSPLTLRWERGKVLPSCWWR